MALVLRLVETRTDSKTRSVDVLEISRPGDLRDIANLGLTRRYCMDPSSGVLDWRSVGRSVLL